MRVLGPLEVWRGGAMRPHRWSEGRGSRSGSCWPTASRWCRSTGSPTRSGATFRPSRRSPPSRATSPGCARRSRPRSRSSPAHPATSWSAPPDCIDADALRPARPRGDRRRRCRRSGVELLGPRWRCGGARRSASSRDLDWARGDAVQLDELRLVAVETLLEARLALGEPARWWASSSASSSTTRCASASGASSWWPCTAPAVRARRSGRPTSSGHPRRRARARSLAGAAGARSADPRRRSDAARRRAGRPPVGRAAQGRVADDATRFVGRDDDVDAIARLETDAPLVTLVGPGGVGKTRLRVRLAATHVGDFADGAAHRRARGDARPAALVQAVAAALDVQQRQHLTLDDTLVDFLRDAQLLIVLDNCEHLVETLGPFVDRIRTRCPGVHVLATSREPLGLPASARGSSARSGCRRVDAAASPRSRAHQRCSSSSTARRRRVRVRPHRRQRRRGRRDLPPPRRPAARARARRGAVAHAGASALAERLRAHSTARRVTARRRRPPPDRCATRSNGRTGS